MKRRYILAAILLIALVLVAVFIVFSPREGDKPFYVGVTFCGNTVAEAKLLIDKVKNYTNLFVLQSGVLQRDANAMNEIGDYATSSGLHFLVYYGVDAAFQTDEWLEWFGAAKQRWGSLFLGIYYGDEPGGKMIDTYIQLSVYGSGERITKLGSGGLEWYSNGTDVTYSSDGTVLVVTSDYTSQNGTLVITNTHENETVAINNVPKPPDDSLGFFPNGTLVSWSPPTVLTSYYPNGTINVLKLQDNILYTAENGSDIISKAEPYSAVLDKNPIKNCEVAAKTYVNYTYSTLEWLNNQSITVLTSDYSLFWWDYLSGYDVVLAQLGWNNTVAQEIGLVRGAANLQGKDWGAMITWKYTEDPYLASGDEIYSQMRTAYECGAEYVVVFNYAENMTGPYGILKPEHFDALERFWNDVVQNPKVVHGGIKAEAALVLPRNYGWGMRRPDDTVWGLWKANSTSQQIWTQLQSALAAHGSRLDIVYDDPAYPVAGKYPQILYWNQTS
jgi:hypothetical protein